MTENLPDFPIKDEDLSEKFVVAAQNAYKAYAVLDELASQDFQEAKDTLNKLFEISEGLQRKHKKEGK